MSSSRAPSPVSAPDTRASSRRILARTFSLEKRGLGRLVLSVLLGFLVWVLPDLIDWHGFETLSEAARVTLAILVTAACLWISEAIPAFAVALFVIGAEIALLGRPGGVWAAEGDTKAWTAFVDSWSSALMWLFLGGFILAFAAQKTGLDQWIAARVLPTKAKSSTQILAVVMGLTFLFSMFMSNTATAAMMLTVVAPFTAALPPQHALSRTLFLAIAISANLGGIATIIGSPPNAIAAQNLDEAIRPDFLHWMKLGLPPAFMLALIAFFYLRWQSKQSLPLDKDVKVASKSTLLKHPCSTGQRWFVAVVFVGTIGLWMTESLHKIPAPVISFLPITLFSVAGILQSADIRKLPWDVLLLLAGGMSLGDAVTLTGLADWMGSLTPSSWSTLSIIGFFSFLAVVLSNLMSNTATASILLPVGIGIIGATSFSASTHLAVLVAIACSSAMCMPISTPPNAIAFSSGKLKFGDFLIPGILMGVLGPLVGFFWMKVVF